ncbi:hypothetical protein RHO13_01400 [Orbus wheelerorum]|uniref:HIT family protein n=1 Tax=Orbus wheelerorum TaxID=3074111 RepID=UPI00370D53B2
MQIPANMLIKQTAYWNINHRINSALPGYIMLSSRLDEGQLHLLPQKALTEMTYLMSKIDYALNELLTPNHLYISRYGHNKNLAIHFHFIPITQWLINLFWQDQRYRQLQSFGAENPETITDGAELTFFIWREFCERPDPPIYQGPSREMIIEKLKVMLA